MGYVSGATALVGRRAELEICENTLRGESGLVLVTGDAGIGKTRLVTEVLDRAQEHGAVTLAVGCLPLAEKLPLLPVTDALRELDRLTEGRVLDTALDQLPGYVRAELAWLLPRLADGGSVGGGGQGGSLECERLFPAVADVLLQVAKRAPVVLLVEDVHWADRATLDLLTFLRAVARRSRLSLIVTCSDEVPLAGLVVEWLAHCRGAMATEIRLAPLSREEVALQAGGLVGTAVPTGFVDELYARAEGNPFLTAQLVAAALTAPEGGLSLPRQLPGGLEELLLTRARQVSDDARAALSALAVAGRPLTEPTLAHVAGLDQQGVRSALRELSAAALLAPADGGGTCRPRHALLAEAVLAELLPGERMALHARTAEVVGPDLLDAGVSGDDSGLIGGPSAPVSGATGVRLRNREVRELSETAEVDKKISPLYIHVRDYGAVGDGVTDDYAAITAALTAAWAAKLPLHFDAKIYAVAQELTIPSPKQTIIRGSRFVDGKATTLKATAKMRAVLSIGIGSVIEDIAIDGNRLALTGLYFQTASLGSFKGISVSNCLRDGICLPGELDTTTYGSGAMTLEMARFLRADNCWIKTLTPLASVQCNVTAGNPVITFTGSVNLTTLRLDGDVNQPATVVLKSGNTIWKGGLLSVDSPMQITVRTTGFYTPPTFTATGADFLINNFRHTINDTNSFYDTGCGSNGQMWVTAGCTADFFDGINKTVMSGITAAVTSGSAVVTFTGSIDLYALKLRQGDCIRVGTSAWRKLTVYPLDAKRTNGGNLYQVITAGTSTSSGTSTNSGGPTGTGADITDGTVHWQYIGVATPPRYRMISSINSPTQLTVLNVLDYTSSGQDWCIASGDGYHECPSSDNNINSFQGSSLWRGNACCAMAFSGLYGPYVVGQQIDYAGMYAIRVGQGGPVITPMFVRNYNESSGSGKAFLLVSTQGCAIHQPLDNFGTAANNVDLGSSVAGVVTGTYNGRDGVYELSGAGTYVSSVAVNTLSTPSCNGLLTYSGQERNGAALFAATIGFAQTKEILDPNNVDYLLASTPTFTLSSGAFVVLAIKTGQSGRVTLQSEELLAGSKLKLRSNRISLGAGQSILLFCDGFFWYEMGRYPDNTETRMVSTQTMSPGQLVACVYDDTDPDPRGSKRMNASLASANGRGLLAHPVGVNPGVVSFPGTHFDMQNTGEIHIPDLAWTAPDAAWPAGVPALTDVGKAAYLSETTGMWTMTAPTASGSTVMRCGTITVGGTGMVMVLIGFGNPTVVPY